MRLLTEAATLKCQHMGSVDNVPSQQWVRVDSQRVLVENDPEGRDIDLCPNRGPEGIKPCTTTLLVHDGYSTFVTIDSHAVCLDDLWGLTDGTPPGAVRYTVLDSGQQYVEAAG